MSLLGYEYISTYEEASYRFKRLIKIMRYGCGREYCFCRYCKANPDALQLSHRDINNKAREYSRREVDLCEDVPEQKSLQMEEIKKLEKSYTSEREFLDFFNERILELFSSYDALNVSFMKNFSKKQKITENNAHIDFDAIDIIIKIFHEAAKDKQYGQNSCRNVIKDGVTQSIISFKEYLKEKRIFEVGQLRFILILLEIPVIFDYDYNIILISLIKFVLETSPKLKTGLIKQLSKYPQKRFLKLLHVFKDLISEQIQAQSTDINYLQNLILFTKVMFEANKFTNLVANDEFYIHTITDENDPREEYAIWLDNKVEENQEFTFIDYPWILDIGFKSKILQEESKCDMEKEIREDVLTLIEENNFSTTDEALMALQNMYFKVQVRRDNLIEDAMNQITQGDNSFKKPMKVKFEGEQGVDEGGVKKEFFQLLSKELLTSDFGMFTEKGENKELLWFTLDSLEVPLNFELTGTMLALAIYNSVNLEAKFPVVIYKKLLDQPLSLKDINEFDPHVYRGLKYILEFDGDLEEALCLTFQISYEVFGETKYHDLIPNGNEVYVTQENKKKYIQLYIDWLLNKSIEKQFRAFYRGFHKVVTGEGIRLFIGEELMTLICGSPRLDFHELEKVAFYEDGYNENSILIKNFWEVIHDMTPEEQKKFMMFCTGSDRAPIKGLGTLPFIISRNGPDTDTLPSAHTCFNHLLLPEYDSKEKLKQKLLQAIENFAGFGLC